MNSSAATMVLLRDDRHGRLLNMFAARTWNLELRRGTLGVVRDYGSPTVVNRAGVQTALHSQVGEAPNHDRVEGARGGS